MTNDNKQKKTEAHEILKIRKAKQIEATELLYSHRGAFIISQALCLAIEELEKVEPSEQEWSNILDMKLFRDELFPSYLAVARLKLG